MGAIVRAVLTAFFWLWDLVGRPENRFARALWAIFAALVVVSAYDSVRTVVLLAEFENSDRAAVAEEEPRSQAPEDDYATDWSGYRTGDPVADLDDDLYGSSYSASDYGSVGPLGLFGLIFSQLLGFCFSVLVFWAVLGGLAALVENTHQIRKRQNEPPASGA